MFPSVTLLIPAGTVDSSEVIVSAATPWSVTSTVTSWTARSTVSPLTTTWKWYVPCTVPAGTVTRSCSAMSVGAVAGPMTGEHVPSIPVVQTFSEIDGVVSAPPGSPVSVTSCVMRSIRAAARLIRLTIWFSSDAVSTPWMTAVPPVYCASCV